MSAPTSNPSPKPSAAAVAAGATSIVLAVIAYLFGLFVGWLGFSPDGHCGGFGCNDNALGIGALVLLAILAAAIVLSVVFGFGGRRWLTPVVALASIIAGWAITYTAAGFTAFGV